MRSSWLLTPTARLSHSVTGRVFRDPLKRSLISLSGGAEACARGTPEARCRVESRDPMLHLQFGPFTLITAERRLFKHGEPVSLTPKAFDLLSILATRAGRLVTKTELMQVLWPDTTVEESNLSYHVFAIRKALGGSGEADSYIETVPKQGYRFNPPAATTPAGTSSSSPLPSMSDAVRFQSAVTGRLAEAGAFSVSPDGRHLVFAAEGADGIL